jgi:DNA-binding NarL/FixJ family response regulator
MKLFIADDNVHFRTRLASVLGGIAGIEIIGEAGDVSATLKAIQETKPDTIILDIHMPGGSGFDVLPVAKAAKPAPVVIMLTVDSRSEYQTRSFLLGADYFFEKSSELRKMAGILKRLAKKNAPCGRHGESFEEAL